MFTILYNVFKTNVYIIFYGTLRYFIILKSSKEVKINQNQWY